MHVGCGGRRRVKVDASWEDGIAISRDWTAMGGAVWGHEKFEMPMWRGQVCSRIWKSGFRGKVQDGEKSIVF